MSVNRTLAIEAVLMDVKASGEDWQRQRATEALRELGFIRDTARKVLDRRTTVLDADLRSYMESITKEAP